MIKLQRQFMYGSNFYESDVRTADQVSVDYYFGMIACETKT